MASNVEQQLHVNDISSVEKLVNSDLTQAHIQFLIRFSHTRSNLLTVLNRARVHLWLDYASLTLIYAQKNDNREDTYLATASL